MFEKREELLELLEEKDVRYRELVKRNEELEKKNHDLEGDLFAAVGFPVPAFSSLEPPQVMDVHHSVFTRAEVRLRRSRKEIHIIAKYLGDEEFNVGYMLSPEVVLQAKDIVELFDELFRNMLLEIKTFIEKPAP